MERGCSGSDKKRKYQSWLNRRITSFQLINSTGSSHKKHIMLPETLHGSQNQHQLCWTTIPAYVCLRNWNCGCEGTSIFCTEQTHYFTISEHTYSISKIFVLCATAHRSSDNKTSGLTECVEGVVHPSSTQTPYPSNVHKWRLGPF